MDLGARLRAFAVLNNPTAEGACNLFGEVVWDWIAKEKLTPEQLQELILQNRPILMERLSDAKAGEIAKIRGMVAQVMPSLDRNVHYALVIHRVSDHSQQHALALMLHHQWLVAQLDAALDWLLNGSAAAAAQ